MTPRSTMHAFAYLVLLCGHPPVQAQFSKQQPCEREASDKVLLARDPITRKFTLISRLGSDNTDYSIGNFRRLERSDLTDGSLRMGILPGATADEPDVNHELDRDLLVLDPNSTDISELFYAWECGCHNEIWDDLDIVYCPLDIETCLRPSRRSELQTPGCRNLPNNYDSRRYTIMLCAAWFGALFFALFISNLGSSLFGFCASRCFPCWNERSVDRLMRRNPDRATHMIRIFLVRQQRALEQAIENNRNQISDTNTPDQVAGTRLEDSTQAEEEKLPPTSLALRTRRYCATTDRSSHFELENEDATEYDGDQCSICFNSFVDGERVGALKCDHLFHVDCLKMWLQRRNACPLCQTKDIAQPRYDEIEPESSDITLQTSGEPTVDTSENPTVES